MLFRPEDHALVVGGGMSGLSVCRFLLDKHVQVTLADRKNRENVSSEILDLEKQGVKLMLGGMLSEQLRYDPDYSKQLKRERPWDYCIKSPGIDPSIPLIKRLLELDIPVLGDIELLSHLTDDPIIGITGTNGKTTTTTLMGEIFKDAGLATLVGGNIGHPVLQEVEQHHDAIVLELSSFQLETCFTFRPHIAVILNITPDHLDRHGTLENYLAAKARIYQKQTADDVLVLNYDDPLLRELPGQDPQPKSKIIFFSRQQILPQGVFVEGGKVVIAYENGNKIEKVEVIAVDDIRIKGGHNVENAMAAIAAAWAFGVKPGQIAETLKRFGGVEHRLEVVAEQNGILFINDSKGTNPDSTIKALQAYDRPIVLLAGGRNKGSDFGALMPVVKERVKHMVVLGEAKNDFINACQRFDYKTYELADSFKEALDKAIAAAEPGDIVMLSPACASWDMFRNFEERGNLFKMLVRMAVKHM